MFEYSIDGKKYNSPSLSQAEEKIKEIEKIEKAIQGEAHVASIDAPLTDDESQTMVDTLASSSEYAADRQVDHESMCSELMQVLCSVLSERECKIVIQSFGIGCQERGLEDIGNDMGLARERVRQIRERGIDKIRKSSKSRILLRHIG